MRYCCLSLLSLCSSSQCCVDVASALFLSAAYLLLTRYANFVYIGLDAHWLISTYKLQARLQRHYWWEWCVCSTFASVYCTWQAAHSPSHGGIEYRSHNGESLMKA